MIELNRLTQHFHPDLVEWFVGATTQDKKKGMAMPYVDARVVMDRLDAVCGLDGWQCRYSHADKKTVCEIGIRISLQTLSGDPSPHPTDHEWVWKADGAGDTDFEADKGALSGAFKRAAVRWGIGRYLYEIDAPWVAIKPRGQSFVIEDAEKPRLKALLQKFAAGPGPTPAPLPAPTAGSAQDSPSSVDEKAARAAFNRVLEDIMAARSVADVDTAIAARKHDLEVVKRVSAKRHDELHDHARTRKSQLEQ